jgi:molybdate transport system substrate-binding protein
VEQITLNVSAAASLTDAITDINARFMKDNPGINVIVNFGSSGTIQQQIENGAPCDVFISASTVQMDNLDRKGLLWPGTRRNLLNNTLVLVVPSSSTLDIRSFAGLNTDKVKRIAVGDLASVPAGDYAKKALEMTGIWSQVQPKLVLAGTVRQVLAYVETGDVDAGLVFVTDALTSDKVRVVASAPQEINATIAYPAAIIAGSQNAPAAGDYIDFLMGPVGRSIFEVDGFRMAQ